MFQVLFKSAYIIDVIIFNIAVIGLMKKHLSKINWFKILNYNLNLILCFWLLANNIKLYVIFGALLAFLITFLSTVKVPLVEDNGSSTKGEISNKNEINHKAIFISSVSSFFFWPQIILLNIFGLDIFLKKE